MAEKIIFPMQYMRITTGINELSHLGSNAIDCAGKDTGIDNAWAPFTGTIKKKYELGHTVWIESNSPVEFADGTVDYATASFTHDSIITDLSVGQVIQQGQVFYQEGTANATGAHIHLEIGRGKFTGTGWYKNAQGNWVINNSYIPYNAFWLRDDTVILNGHNYPWKREESMAIIQDAPNWYGRCNDSHWRIRGRELGRESFLNYVGKDFLHFIEDCSDDPEAAMVQNWQTVGKTAVQEDWQGKIVQLTSDLSAANTTVTDLQAQIVVLSAEITDLKKQFLASGSDTIHLNALGELLQWFIVRLGLKK